MKEKPKLIKFTKELCRLVETMLKEDYSLEQNLNDKRSNRETKTNPHIATHRHNRQWKSGHKDIATALGIDVYFASPYHSWERGANENMNGLIRQYLPKGSSFEDLTDEDISFIQNRLNNRQRKKLGFLTPPEYFFANFATITNGLTDKLHL